MISVIMLVYLISCFFMFTEGIALVNAGIIERYERDNFTFYTMMALLSLVWPVWWIMAMLSKDKD